MILLDTSGLLANYDRSDGWQSTVSRILAQPQRRLLSPFIMAELDYLLTRIAGQSAALEALDDVVRGAYELVSFGADDVASAKTVIERYADLHLGLADASLVVLSHRYNCGELLTLDQRHFRVVDGPLGRPFRILPFDHHEPTVHPR